jgi:hypothetical protein
MWLIGATSASPATGAQSAPRSGAGPMRSHGVADLRAAT